MRDLDEEDVLLLEDGHCFRSPRAEALRTIERGDAALRVARGGEGEGQRSAFCEVTMPSASA
nr:hypothetical protein [Corallococcus exiguus]